MPAPRKYTDEQRRAVYRLHQAGHGAKEIARRCWEGESGLPAFEIAERTAHAIATKQAAEEDARAVWSLSDVSLEDVKRFPVRIAALVSVELERLEDKAAVGALPPKDLRRLDALEAVCATLTAREGSGRSIPPKVRDRAAQATRRAQEKTRNEIENGSIRTRKRSEAAAKARALLERWNSEREENRDGEGRADQGDVAKLR